MPDTIPDITADISVEELVEAYPKAVGFLMDRDIVCIKCGEPVWGTLRDMIEQKQKNPDEIVAALREFLRKTDE